MSTLSFDKIRKLFQVSDIQSINDYRSNLNTVPFDWKNQPPIICDIDNLEITSGQYRYRTFIDGIAFESLLLPHNSSKLVISLCGGGRGIRRYPDFLRWTYYNYFNANYLCIDDPMYDKYKTAHVLWYYGNKNTSYIEYLYKLIKKFIDILEINIEDIIFLGSSGGGTIAIHMANKFSGSTAISINPQFYPSLWSDAVNTFFQSNIGVNLFDDDKYNRHKVIPNNKKSRFFIACNIASKNDCKQFIPMFDELSIPLTYGIYQHNNIITWLYHNNGSIPHSTNPEKLGFVLMSYLNDEIKNGKNINEINNLSYIINEYMNMFYTCKKQLEQYKSIPTKLLKFTKMRYFILSKISFKKNHYKNKYENIKKIMG